MLTEEAIYNIIKEDVEKSADRLVGAANDLGGYDNITVVIIQNA
jgi:serine/threonine protein phosphatase PrpC